MRNRIWRRVLMVFISVALVLGMLSPVSVYASPEMLDGYTSDNDGLVGSIYGATNMRCQTFVATSTYEIYSVQIKSWRVGTPGTVTAELRTVDVDHRPTATVLAQGTADTASWPTTEGTRAFNEIVMSSYTCMQDTEYAIVVSAIDGDSSNKVCWIQNTNSTYTDGYCFNTINGGSSWISGGSDDLVFKVYGNALNPASGAFNTVTSITGTAATLSYTVSSLGENTTVDVSFEYGYTTDDDSLVPSYDYTTNTTTVDSTPTTVTESISNLIPGQKVYYRIKLDGDVVDFTGQDNYFLTLAPPSIISENNIVNKQGIITHVFQRKGFYAAGRYWMIYCKGASASPVGGFYYKSSIDGITWTDPYLFIEAEKGITLWLATGGNEADELNTYFDGTYLHAVYIWNRYDATYDIGSEIWYRHGIPNNDGTITWSSTWIKALDNDGVTVKGYASIVTDTNGYPYIDYWQSDGVNTGDNSNYGTPDGNWNRYVIKSSTKDGTFTVASGYPFLLKSNIGNRGTGTLVQMSSGKLYWVGCGEIGNYVTGRLYDGTTWGNAESIATDAVGLYRYSVVTRGDIIYLVYLHKDKDTVYFTKRLDTGWTTPISVVTGITDTTYPCSTSLSMNQATGDLYLFYNDNDTGKIYYKLCPNTTGIWSEPIEFVDESYQGLAKDIISSHLGSFMEVYGGKLGVYYVQAYHDWAYSSTASYMDLKFSYLLVEAGAAVNTNEASNITQTAATLQGYLVNDGGNPTTVRFDWGTTIAYGNTTEWQSKDTGDTFTANLINLISNTTYYYRAVAKWADGTITYGTGKVFATITLGLPTVTTGSAIGVTINSATLQGSITALGDYSTVYVYFQYGLTTSYGTNTLEQTKTTVTGYSADIASLAINTTYHFRSVLRYGDGLYVYGSDNTFTTATSSILAPTNVNAVRGDTVITVSWTKDSQATNTLVRRAIDGYPNSISSGTQVYIGTGSSVQDTGLSNSQNYYYSLWSEKNGVYSLTYATVYSSVSGSGSGTDALAQPLSMSINAVKVFGSYNARGDKLIVFNMWIDYAKMPSQNVRDFFVIQIDYGGEVIAQVSPPYWGHTPASVYLAPESTMTWGSPFTIRVVGLKSKWSVPPSVSYSVDSTNWNIITNTIVRLDQWVLASAALIDDDYILVSATGEYLTDEVGIIYNKAIQGLSSKVPKVFATSVGYVEVERPTSVPTGSDDLGITNENIGDELDALFSKGADVLGLDDSNTFGLAVVILMVLVFFAGGVYASHSIGAYSIGFGGIAALVPTVAGVFFGLIPLVALLVVVGLIIAYFATIIFLRGMS